MEDNNPFIYRFYSNWWNENRVTIVGTYENGVLKMAASRCSTSDNFCKKTGRGIAEKRLADNKLVATFPLKECNSKIFRHLATSVSYLVEEDARLVGK